jgi:hypothetical protein
LVDPILFPRFRARVHPVNIVVWSLFSAGRIRGEGPTYENGAVGGSAISIIE